MARSRKTAGKDGKAQALRRRGVLNAHADRVVDPLFADSDFFDPRDSIQVKYEMVRRVRADGQSISRSAAAFGMSRPTFYQAQAALEHGGMAALVPKKPGPRRAHKLDREVVDFLKRLRAEDPSLRPAELAERVLERFGRKVHPRSVERALARKKNGDDLG
jgi:transposase